MFLLRNTPGSKSVEKWRINLTLIVYAAHKEQLPSAKSVSPSQVLYQ